MKKAVTPEAHIMLDLETLDTTPSAVVLSIGAAVFDPNGRGIIDTFYAELTEDLDVQQRLGRTISGSTVRWWMAQDILAKAVFTDHPREENGRMATAAALVKFGRFVEKHGGKDAVRLWGNGADFDNAILGSLYDAFDLVKPWSYGKNRCYRTIKADSLIIGELHKRIPFDGVPHNALDDAKHQALCLQEIYACQNLR